jgi:transglutaminase-like putative cysteine protease
MRPLRRVGPDVWVLLASVIAAVAVARLFEGGLGGSASAPLLVSAAVGSGVPALLAMARVPLPLRAIAGTVAVILTSVWTVVAAATASGLPRPHTWYVVQSDLRVARPLLAQFAVPLRTAPGLVFLATMTCGIVAVVASVVLHASETTDRLYPGWALLCPLGLLAFACSQSTPGSMALPVVLFVAAGALAFTSVGTEPAPRSEASRRWRWVPPAALTACTMAGVVLVAVLVDANAGGAGLPSGVAPAVPLSAESLTSNLLSLEVHDANVVLFQAHSRYRTYWQVAVLNDLRNGVWVPDPDTEHAADGSAGAASAAQSGAGAGSPRGRAFEADVNVDDLSSRILPVPPGTIALVGTTATLTAVGAVSPTPTTSGEQYSARSEPPVSDPSSLGGNAAVAADPPALLQAETALPALPASIEALARAVTSGAQSPLAQAELLVNWFRSGQFHYTLDPPATPAGTNPLVGFLTQTRAGSCEQFAGAYVVLARSLGLPSRVVVGFTAGHYSGPGQVTIRGADAHAWPQVYLGPRAGWVSFEPTPQQPRGELAPEGVVGPSGVNTTTPAPTGSTPTTAPTPSAPLTVPTTVPTPIGSNGATPPTIATPQTGSGPGILGWILIGVAGVLASVLAVLLVRRRRRWSPAGRTPDQLALLAQAEVKRAVRQSGLDLPLWQPLDLFFEDLSAGAQAGDGASSLIADGVMVAEAGDAALFDPLATSEDRGRAAYRAALRVRDELKDRKDLESRRTKRLTGVHGQRE